MNTLGEAPSTIPEALRTISPSKLAWIYSLVMGICAFASTIIFFLHASTLISFVLSPLSAVLCARIAGWIAGLDDRSHYGFLACFIFILISPLSSTLLLDFWPLVPGVQRTFGAYATFFIPHYVFGL